MTKFQQLLIQESEKQVLHYSSYIFITYISQNPSFRNNQKSKLTDHLDHGVALHHGTDMVPDTRGGQECARRSASALAPPPLLKHSLALSGLRESPHTAVIIVLSVARAGSTLSTQNSRLLLDRLYFSVWGENMATFVTSNLNTWGERLVTSCARPRGPEEKSNLVSAFTKFLGLPSLQWMER